MDHIDSPPINSSPISKSTMLQKVMRTPTRTLHCCRTATPSQKKRILSTSYWGSFNFRLILSDHFISSNNGSISCNFNITLQPPVRYVQDFWKVFCYLPAHWEASVGIRPDEGRATVAENDQHQEELLYLEHHPGAVRDQGNHGGYVVEK